MMEQRKVKKMTNELLIKISRYKGTASKFIWLFSHFFTRNIDQIPKGCNKTWKPFLVKI
jgi:hypothetical protein